MAFAKFCLQISVECRFEHQDHFLESPDLSRFNWRMDLSETGQWLYELLVGEAGDTDLLPILAVEEEIDLNAALNELRSWGILDERDPARIRLHF